ncbi:hypothetical protein [Aliarcobacter butzleri]|uniref:hypothetical protein n=1 Tax=Aliarcobacter butzleri TaxID=28197 RepID=UPI00215AF6EF|nr:hypothetical protein [Aliarcobacter butzleri]MCR8709840.1 hypothetical protein [Aliarcobacter butzleri]
MKKFRILRRGKLYYPQWRYFFTWYGFYNELIGYETICHIVFDSEEKALEFINKVEYETININKTKQSNSNFSLFSFGNTTQQNNN